MATCLHDDPAIRPTAEQLLKEKFVKNIRNPKELLNLLNSSLSIELENNDVSDFFTSDEEEEPWQFETVKPQEKIIPEVTIQFNTLTQQNVSNMAKNVEELKISPTIPNEAPSNDENANKNAEILSKDYQASSHFDASSESNASVASFDLPLLQEEPKIINEKISPVGMTKSFTEPVRLSDFQNKSNISFVSSKGGLEKRNLEHGLLYVFILDIQEILNETTILLENFRLFITSRISNKGS